MRVGIDCKNILNTANGEYAGVGYYSHYLVSSLIKSFPETKFLLFFYDEKLDLSPYKKENTECKVVPFIKFKKFFPFFYSHLFIPIFFYFQKIDIMHFLAPVRPLLYFKKNIVTVHDLAIYRNPDWFPKLKFFFNKVLVPCSIKCATAIIAVSQSTADDLVKIFNIDSRKIHVIYEGVSDMELDEKSNFNKLQELYPYFLYIGTIEPRKNISLIVDAYEIFLEKNPETKIKLVLAGKIGWKSDDLFKKIQDKKFKNKIIYLGYVTNQEKIYLYSNAISLVYPSFFEGFGLQLLEAMKMSLPIITSNEGAISEVVIDNALMIPTNDKNALYEAFERILNDDSLREELIEKGVEIVKNFNWEKVALETYNVYKNTI